MVITDENLQRCRFSFLLSPGIALTCSDSSCLIDLSSAFFSPICHFPRRPGAGGRADLADGDHWAGAPRRLSRRVSGNRGCRFARLAPIAEYVRPLAG